MARFWVLIVYTSMSIVVMYYCTVTTVGGCPPEHFPSRLAAYIRRRVSLSRVLFARSFAHSVLSFSLALASLSSALLRSRLCSSSASLSSLLASCLAFSLVSPRASPFISSRPDTPLHYSTFGFYCKLYCCFRKITCGGYKWKRLPINRYTVINFYSLNEYITST